MSTEVVFESPDSVAECLQLMKNQRRFAGLDVDSARSSYTAAFSKLSPAVKHSVLFELTSIRMQMNELENALPAIREVRESDLVQRLEQIFERMGVIECADEEKSGVESIRGIINQNISEIVGELALGRKYAKSRRNRESKDDDKRADMEFLKNLVDGIIAELNRLVPGVDCKLPSITGVNSTRGAISVMEGRQRSTIMRLAGEMEHEQITKGVIGFDTLQQMMKAFGRLFNRYRQFK